MKRPPPCGWCGDEGGAAVVCGRLGGSTTLARWAAERAKAVAGLSNLLRLRAAA